MMLTFQFHDRFIVVLHLHGAAFACMQYDS